jgi:hypothetical protein
LARASLPGRPKAPVMKGHAVLDRQRNTSDTAAATTSTPLARPRLGLPKRPRLTPAAKPLSTQQSDFTAEGAPAPGKVGAGLPPEQPSPVPQDLTPTKEAADDAI